MWAVKCVDYAWKIVDESGRVIVTVNEFIEKARLICEKHNMEVGRIYEGQD